MNLNQEFNWQNILTQKSSSYICGYCNTPLASERGWEGAPPGGGRKAYIYICHKCNRPTFFDPAGDQVPGVTFGDPVKEITDQEVLELYEEARKTTGANSYTATVLCCRKLLMHIAVSKGAKEGQSFSAYVDFLADNNFVPPDAKSWVDHIRKKGNEANHEINIIDKGDAEELLTFVEMLLKIIYEFPATAKKKYTPKSTQTEEQKNT